MFVFNITSYNTNKSNLISIYIGRQVGVYIDFCCWESMYLAIKEINYKSMKEKDSSQILEMIFPSSSSFFKWALFKVGEEEWVKNIYKD